MLRSILAFVTGYVVMGVLVMTGFIVGPLLLGIDRVFTPGTYDASTLWQWSGLLIGLVGAFVGGAACRLISRGPRTPMVLAAVAVAFAVVGGLTQKPRVEPAPVRPAQQSTGELMTNIAEHAREPLFTRITNPIAAALGIALGSAVVGRKRPVRPTAA